MGDVRVSTVFTGVWFTFERSFWHTTAFSRTGRDFGKERCGGSWDQAEEMHRRMVRRVREALGISEPEEVE